MNNSPFPIRGVIEGFYGPFYTFPERDDLIRFMGRHGFNLYVYGPKNDRQHRNRWREPYPAEIMSHFAETIAIARASGVTFCYAISPNDYDSRTDFDYLTAKLRAFYDLGIRAFSLFVDDILCKVHYKTNCRLCNESAEPDAELCNRLFAWLQALDPVCTFSMCPRIYHGTPPFAAYLYDLGRRLDQRIDILFTGPDVCAPAITTADAQAVADAVQRPPLIWDNYPVNDLAMRPEMHIGPLRGRDSTLYHAVRGIVFNPMLQPEASKIPLRTCADYLADPHAYDPDDSWARALAEVGGAEVYESLLAFAENSLASCLRLDDDSRLGQLAAAALAALEQDEPLSSTAPRALATYLSDLDEAGYALKHHMRNWRLRHDLLPWIETLDAWLWIGKRSLRLLGALADGRPFDYEARDLRRAIEDVVKYPPRVAGVALLPLARYALEQAEQRHRSDFVDQRAPVAPSGREQLSFG